MKRVDHAKLAREVASTLSLLDDKGELIELDSIGLVEYVLGLEERLGSQLADEVSMENFKSLETVSAMLARVAS